MTDVDDVIRRAIREVADSGHPVNVGTWALARARRRVRRRVSIALVAVTVVAVVVPVSVIQRIRQATEQPGGGLDNKSVITSYFPAGGSGRMVLSPETGEYRFRLDYHTDAVVSPNLRLAASANLVESVLITSTVDGGLVIARAPAGRWLHSPAWSPDSRQIAAADVPALRFDPSGAVLPDQPRRDVFHQITIIDAATGRNRQVPLMFPAGRGGVPDGGVGWLGSDRLVVPSGSPADRLPLGPGQGVDPVVVIDRISVFDLTGRLVADHVIDQHAARSVAQPQAGLLWQPSGMAPDGDYLLTRRPQQGTLELAEVDLGAAGPYRVVTFPVPTPPAGKLWQSRPVGYLADGRALVESILVDGSTWVDARVGNFLDRRHDAIDLATGQVQRLELHVPPDATDLTVGAAAGLGTRAAHVAF